MSRKSREEKKFIGNLQSVSRLRRLVLLLLLVFLFVFVFSLTVPFQLSFFLLLALLLMLPSSSPLLQSLESCFFLLSFPFIQPFTPLGALW